MDIDEAQSNRRGENMAKLRSACWGAAKWLIRVTDHITKNDRYDQQFHSRRDNVIQEEMMISDIIQEEMMVSNVIQEKIMGDDDCQ